MKTRHGTAGKRTPSRTVNATIVGICAGSIGVLGAIGVTAGIVNADGAHANSSPTAPSEPATSDSGEVAPGDSVASLDTLDEDMADYDACWSAEYDAAGQDLAQGNGDASDLESIDEMAREACSDLLPDGVEVFPAEFIDDETSACIDNKMGITSQADLEALEQEPGFDQLMDEAFAECDPEAAEVLDGIEGIEAPDGIEEGATWAEWDLCLERETGIDVPGLNAGEQDPDDLTDAEIDELHEAGWTCAEELMTDEEYDQFVEDEAYWESTQK